MVRVPQAQRERAAMLEVDEVPHNLPVIMFAKLAGKSCDPVNRDIKVGRLLTVTMGSQVWARPSSQRCAQSTDGAGDVTLFYTILCASPGPLQDKGKREA